MADRYDSIKIHGMSRTRPYSIWRNMKHRCEYKKHESYERYGAKGIKVLWNSFDDFWKDMKDGYSDDLQIDRINNSKGYSKNNCRWVTPTQNILNREPMGVIKYRGVTNHQGKYRARIWADNKTFNIGVFDNPEHAAMEYDKYCIVNNIDKKLNFKQECHG